ncbi:hypothetical protein BG004_006199 [Podila humilis]|nr:hypothetical protein BG004_006199 [Podila humilis]
MDLSLVFLLWLCMTLVLSPFESDAQRVDAPNGVNRVQQFDQYFPCENCPSENGDDRWFCGHVDGVTRHGGMACKRKAIQNQPCHNETMPCISGMVCSGVNNINSTCTYTPELWKEYQEEVRSRRITMAGMIVILIGMFLAMRRMLKNEESRRRQIWEPVDSSAEASILQRLAEDTQRRVAGGWGQISGSLVEGGNAASAAVGTAFSRIRNNVRNATANVGGGSGRAADDCDDSMEMLPNGRRNQTRRELEADMRDFLLEGSDDEDDDEDEGHAWDQVRDDDGLLARHNSSSRSVSGGNIHPGTSSSVSSSASSFSGTHGNNNINNIINNNNSNNNHGSSSRTSNQQEEYPDEPPAYDEVRSNGHAPSLFRSAAGFNSSPSSTTARNDTIV